MVFGKIRYLWRRHECQLPKTRFTSKSRGGIDIITGMMMFVILIIIILGVFQMTQYMVTAAGVEDALAASNLASAVIDVEEYGRSHHILIEDVEKAFQIYRDALCCNLSLDENLNTTNRELLAHKVEILQYIVYNVQGDEVEVCICDGTGRIQNRYRADRSVVVTPDGNSLESTTIYSRIGFWVNGLAGQEIYAEKEKSIDIVRYDSE